MKHQIFTTVSKVLKDNLLLEMKKNNDFMRNYIVKNVMICCINIKY